MAWQVPERSLEWRMVVLFYAGECHSDDMVSSMGGVMCVSGAQPKHARDAPHTPARAWRTIIEGSFLPFFRPWLLRFLHGFIPSLVPPSLSFFLPSFLPSILPFLYFLPTRTSIHCFLPLRPSFLPSFLPSFSHYVFPSFHHTSLAPAQIRGKTREESREQKKGRKKGRCHCKEQKE